MQLTAKIARVRIADYEFQSGDGYLLPDIQITLGENDRSSSCRFSISDPGLLIGAEFNKISIKQGGILVPADLLKDPSKNANSAQSVPIGGAAGNAPVLPEVAKAFEGGSNSLIARAVGHSEGNRTPDGGFNKSYQGHTDPGNGAYNIGSFSYQVKQGGASTPAQADELWMGRLKQQMPRYEAAAKAAGLNPADSRLLANFCDLYTQAPLAATGKGGFLDRMGEIAKGGGSYEAIIAARVNSYRDPGSGRIDAPGFGNSEARLRTDQDRRMTALEAVLSRGGAPPTGKVQSVMAPASQSNSPQPVTTPVGPSATPPAQATPPTESSIKGTEIIIEIGYQPSALIAYHFIHTATNVSKEGKETTTFEGKSLRWLLTREPQTRSFEATTLKQVAEILSSKLGVKLQIEGKGPKYQHLDMTGLTPFQLLQREARAIGYRIADKNNKLILEPAARPEFTDVVIDEDIWISGRFGDTARGDTPTPGTPTSLSDGAAGETKTALDRQTGQPNTLTPNTTKAGGIVTGAAAPKVTGTPASAGGVAAVPGDAKPIKGPEIRKTERQEGHTRIIEEVRIERQEEPGKVTTTTTTKTTKITVTNSSGTKTTEIKVENKVGTPQGTKITTKITASNGTTTENTTETAEIDGKFKRELDQQQAPKLDAYGLPKQPAGIIDLADGRAEAQAIADESKRVKGYESSAVLHSTEAILQLVPGQIIALSPRLFPEPFDREWRVSEVKHDFATMQTSIAFYTPQLPPDAGIAGPAAAATGVTPPGALPVPCWLQTDNKVQPDRTCNTSSCAMVAKYLGANINSDDEYWQIVSKYGDTTDHGAQTAALNQIGIKSTYRDNLEFADIDTSLANKKPVVLGIMHRGSESNPTGGHMIVVIGKTPSGDYIVNDPYGSLNNGYTGDPKQGCGAVYSRAILQKRWLDRGPGTGAGRIFS
jgi:Peptidase_C39 like family